MNKLSTMFVGALGLVFAASPAQPSQLAQIPAQTPAPQANSPEWQRPSIAVADYASGARKDIDRLAATLAELRQRANESGRQERFRQLQQADEKLRIVREKWDKLPQTNQANWDTVRRDFEMAYADLTKAMEEAGRM